MYDYEDSYFPRYVSVEEKRAKANKKFKSLQKKNPNMQPVIIQGRTIAKTWWGKSWNTNLESYADYTNRIGRGRSYVRYGAVLDLQIKNGYVKSLVQGTRSKPYKVEIKIKNIKKETWKNIKIKCRGNLDSLQELLLGHFPKSLSDIFTKRKTGLFPSPKEISFNCNCPDWADMCKHVAATLYGIGVRLDLKPELFFTLRGVKINDLITGAVQEHTNDLLKKAKQKNSKIIEDSNLSEIFGVDIEETMPCDKKKIKSIKKLPVKKLKKPKSKNIRPKKKPKSKI
ncbi:MAG: hypothetical protein KAJ14_14695 [Candidatus Omnitrophica bacterium]|nr:hypothetical protein [Candidatus Omnitrophota bacterium]